MATDLDRELISTYNDLNPRTSLGFVVEQHVPQPTPADYDYGEIVRYFAQVTVRPNGEVIEIDDNTFGRLANNSIYRTVELRWKISGALRDEFDAAGMRVYTGVRTANVKSVENASQTLPAIEQKLTNPLQLWRGY